MVNIQRVPRVEKPKVVADPYALIPTKIGPNSISSRPFEFATVNNTLLATMATTVCPKCSQGIVFTIAEATMVDGILCLACPSCGIGGIAKTVEFESPFADPIAAGALAEEVFCPKFKLEPLEGAPTTVEASAVPKPAEEAPHYDPSPAFTFDHSKQELPTKVEVLPIVAGGNDLEVPGAADDEMLDDLLKKLNAVKGK